MGGCVGGGGVVQLWGEDEAENIQGFICRDVRKLGEERRLCI